MQRDDILTSEVLQRFDGIRFALSTRLGGVSPEPYGMNTSYSVGDNPELVSENRARLFRYLGIGPDEVAIPRQCHSTEVRIVLRGGAVENADALITAAPNVWLAVSVADCVPMFMVDRSSKVISAVHAGWRGSAGRIAEQAIRTMTEAFGTDPEDLFVFIGPSAGKCCYEIGPEVAERFGQSVLEQRNGSVYLDLKQENLRQLKTAGVREEHVEVSDSCTVCNPAIFHSYRRDKERSGRMMGIMGILKGRS